MSSELIEGLPEGWGWPNGSRKAHYFVNGRSLCGKWGWLRGNLEPYGESSPDDCKACTRAIQARRKNQGLFVINVVGF